VEVGRPTFFSMLIIIAAYLPIFTLQRHEGRLFAPMAWTVTSALVGSLALSLTLVPLLCYALLRRPIAHGDNAIVTLAKRAYRPLLDWCLEHGKWLIGAASVCLVGAVALFMHLGTEFLPELDEGTLWVTVTLPPGISVDESILWCRRIRETLHTVPEVLSVISKSGRPEDGSDAKSLNQTESFVDLKPAKEWRSGYTKGRIIDELQHSILYKYPGVEVGVSQPIRDNVLESISQIKGQIVVKVFGDDSSKLLDIARQMKTGFAKIPGVATAFIDRDGETPQAIIEIDRAGAARYGVNIQDVQDLVETALGGKSATSFWEGEQHYGIVIRLPESQRSLDSMRRLLVDTSDGSKITLGQLARFRSVSGPVNISREAGRKVKAVSIFIKDRDMGSIVTDMKTAAAAIALPEGYYLNWSGEFENQERAMARLTIVLPISVFIIFVLLFNAFRSVKSAALILLNVPFSVVGGVLALWARGMPVSVSAAIGFIALFGAAVLSGVVMISYIDQLVEEGMVPLEAVRKGAMTRLRTDLMTATLAILGLLPMALSSEIGSEVQRPLATVLIGGLLSATPLNLTVLPVIYLLIKGARLPISSRSTSAPGAAIPGPAV
jgi:cobalt-zinc-cadmium resistance protein CzcA